MKLALKLLLFLLATLMLEEKSLSLSDYKIKRICMKAKREKLCKKDLIEKRSNLQKGNFIEIPVIPYKGK